MTYKNVHNKKNITSEKKGIMPSTMSKKSSFHKNNPLGLELVAFLKSCSPIN